MTDESSGLFVVLEGGDGSGKSTQVARLADRVREEGRDVVTTFEPGSTALGAQIRRLLLDGGAVDARTEALLMAADRAAHVEQVVRPAIERGAVVVSDRFTPSSIAYQGLGRGLGAEWIEELSAWATRGLDPDLVVVLDVDAQTVAIRLGKPTDRMEREPDDFHARVRKAYRDLAAPRGWQVVDGSGSPDAVAAAVWEAVRPLVR